jgi:hypothetical protein
MVDTLLALADRDNGHGYFHLATLRQAAEKAYPKGWKNETYWPRFPLNRVATNYHTIRSQQSTTESLKLAQYSMLASIVAAAIALVSLLATFWAKDPKLDRNQAEAIIGAIKNAGSPNREPLKMDAAQLEIVVSAIRGMGHQEPAPAPNDGKKPVSPAPSENSSGGASGSSTGGKRNVGASK